MELSVSKRAVYMPSGSAACALPLSEAPLSAALVVSVPLLCSAFPLPAAQPVVSKTAVSRSASCEIHLPRLFIFPLRAQTLNLP